MSQLTGVTLSSLHHTLQTVRIYKKMYQEGPWFVLEFAF